MIQRAELMSLAQWEKCQAEPLRGPIYKELRYFLTPQILSRCLDHLVKLKALCKSAIEKSNYDPDYKSVPTQKLLQQTQLFIEYILNADNAEHAERLLKEREEYRHYYRHYVTAPPNSSAMARALRKANSPQLLGKKRFRFNIFNCSEHMLDLQAGKLCQVNEEQQDIDYENLVGRYSAQDREVYRILPARRHQGYVHMVLQGTDADKQLIIQDFHTHAHQLANNQKLSPWILVVTPEGDQFAINQYLNLNTKHASSSLHFGRAVIFAGTIIAEGQIKELMGDDPHYETEMVNTKAICQHFREVGLLTADTAKVIQKQNLMAFVNRLQKINLPFEKEMLALYGNESNRRSLFNQEPSFIKIWEKAESSQYTHDQLQDRAMNFITIQEYRFHQTLPMNKLNLHINYERHLKNLVRINNDPFIANKENAMIAYEQKKAAQLFDWVCQKTNEELCALKSTLITIISEIITQNMFENLVTHFSDFLQKIAQASMEIDANATVDKISNYVTERNKLFQDLREQQQLKKEHQLLIRQTESQLTLA